MLACVDVHVRTCIPMRARVCACACVCMCTQIGSYEFTTLHPQLGVILYDEYTHTLPTHPHTQQQQQQHYVAKAGGLKRLRAPKGAKSPSSPHSDQKANTDTGSTGSDELGMVRVPRLRVADIPGLIQGAHMNK